MHFFRQLRKIALLETRGRVRVVKLQERSEFADGHGIHVGRHARGSKGHPARDSPNSRRAAEV